jgi:uncharacterized protein YecT (DUF1311 family)
MGIGSDGCWANNIGELTLNKLIWISGIVAALTAAVPTVAADTAVQKRYSRDYDRCMSKSDGVTAAIMDCNGAEIDRQDARLNQAYKMVMNRLDALQKQSLRSSERQWIVSRDKTCQADMRDEEGGSLAAIIYSNCILNATIRRTMWLEAYRP